MKYISIEVGRAHGIVCYHMTAETVFILNLFSVYEC